MESRKIDQATIYKFVGLIVFFVLMGVVIALIWPYISEVFEEGGLERVTTRVRDAGIGGVFILLALSRARWCRWLPESSMVRGGAR